MIILKPSESSVAGEAIHFVGRVWTDEIAIPGKPSRLRVHSVHFSPSSRTAWHRHPVGQILHVVQGVGRVQRRGGPIESVRVGDTVWFEPDEWHWHGADPATFMTHLAIQETGDDGSAADVGEHVTDNEYYG